MSRCHLFTQSTKEILSFPLLSNVTVRSISFTLHVATQAQWWTDEKKSVSTERFVVGETENAVDKEEGIDHENIGSQVRFLSVFGNGLSNAINGSLLCESALPVAASTLMFMVVKACVTKVML